MSCPAPIGPVPKEDCATIASDFGALTVQGALPLAGSGKYADQRLEAIRAVGALAQSIKDQRVKLCERYVKCTVPATEHDAQDQLLSGSMKALIDLWNKRRFSSLDEVVRFRDAVRALDHRVNGAAEGTPQLPAAAPRSFKAEEVLARVEDPGVAFRSGAGSVTVTASADGKREALLSNQDAFSLPAGRRYRIKISGTYHPASPPVVSPGDELQARLKYRAEGEATVQIALRSIEDPDAAEGAETFRTAANEKGAKELKLTADPQQTGFYLGLSVKGAPVEISDLELLRGGKVLVTGRPGEPGVKTDCTASAKPKPGPLKCAPGDGDRITLGQPEGYLILGLRDATGMRASLRALSLEGSRSLDATVGDNARLVVTLVGAGSATFERIEVSDLGL